jgi:anti-anti-sigma factor
VPELYSIAVPVLLPSGYAVVAMRGELDLAAAEDMAAVLAGALRIARTGVVLDLSEVTFIDASGLRAIIRSYQASGHLPGRLRLAGASAHVIRLLELTRPSADPAVFPDVAAAAAGGPAAA